MRAGLAVLVAAAMAVLLPRLALAFFAFPSADDYCIVVETRDDGFWYMQVHSYLTWTGRYSAMFLESIASQFDIAAVYPWFAIAIILATLAAIRALIAAMLGHQVSGRRVTAIAVVVAAVVVGGLPSSVEAFYWMPAAASYQWGIVTYLVWLSLLIRTARRAGARSRVWQRTALVVLAVIVSGFNEVMAPILLATSAVFVALNHRQGFESDRFMLALLGTVIVCTAVSFLAPGNAIRSSVYPALATRHNLEFAVLETARQTGRFIARFGAYPVLWAGALAAWWWGARVWQHDRTTQRQVVYAAALLGLIAVAYLTLFPVYWEYGEVNYTGEGRTYNVTYLVLIAIAVCATGLLVDPIVDRLAARLRTRPAARGRIDLAFALAFAVLLVASPSTLGVFETLKAAPRYLEEEQKRAAVLERSPREGLVFVDKISVRPPGLFWGDLEADESHWINVCVAKYYGLDGVRSRQ